MHIPHPLQNLKSIFGGIVLDTTASGQYNQQLKHAFFPDLTGMHFSNSIIGLNLLQLPVLPASPITGF